MEKKPHRDRKLIIGAKKVVKSLFGRASPPKQSTEGLCTTESASPLVAASPRTVSATPTVAETPQGVETRAFYEAGNFTAPTNTNSPEETRASVATVDSQDGTDSIPSKRSRPLGDSKVPPPAPAATSQADTSSQREGNAPATAAVPGANEIDSDPPPATLESSFRLKNAPLWNRSLGLFKEKHRKEHDLLEAAVVPTMVNGDDSCFQKWNDCFKPVVPARFKHDDQSNSLMQRVRTYLPCLGPLRAVAMTAANFDPHRIAPIVCATVFSTIELAFGVMNPEMRLTTLEILFESSMAINEWIYFEVNFAQKEHHLVEDEVSTLNEWIPEVYLRSLQLLAWIQEHSQATGFERRWDIVTRAVKNWENEFRQLKIDLNQCSNAKKKIDSNLAAEKCSFEILDWIEKDGDPEKGLDSHMKEASSDGRYLDYGKWFLDVPQYKDWINGFEKDTSGKPNKRVLWIRGNYGTGKSTLVCRVISSLQQQIANPSRENGLRIVSYFCAPNTSSGKRPDFETIIRSLAKKLSWTPEFKIASRAHARYNSRRSSQSTSSDPWEDLLRDIIDEISRESMIVFIVDALDECSSSDDPGKLLGFMARIIKASPKVFFLCSSRKHVPVRTFLGSIDALLDDLEVLPEMTKTDMERVVKAEINARRELPGKSLFFLSEHQDLLTDLEQSLIEHAHGMFVWVKIWLGIMLPEWSGWIERPDLATKKLQELKSSQIDADDKLKAAYQRLWDVHCENKHSGEQFAKEQVRLFHLVLCSIVPLTTDHVTSALRIRSDSYDKYLTTDQVKHLCANFLVEDAEGHLQFAHSTARSFIMSIDAAYGNARGETGKMFDSERNHRSVASTCITLMKDRDHPAWKTLFAGTDLDNRSETYMFDIQLFQSQDYLQRIDRPLYRWAKLQHWTPPDSIYTSAQGYEWFAVYVLFFWWNHFMEAYRNKPILHSGWIEFIDTIVLPPQSAYVDGIMAFLGFYTSGPNDDQNAPYRSSVRVGISSSISAHDLSLYSIMKFAEGGMILSPLHALAGLHFMEDAEFDENELHLFAKSTSNPKSNRLKSLLQHMRTESTSTESALHVACRYRNPAVARLFLRGTLHEEGERAALDLLYVQSDSGIPLQTCLNGEVDSAAIVKLLLDFEADVEARIGQDQLTALRASGNKGPQLSHPTSGWRRKDTTSNLLFEALANAEEHAVSICLQYAKPDNFASTDRDGNTALHIAAKRNFVSVGRALVQKRSADVHARNKEGETPLDIAVFNLILDPEPEVYTMVECLLGCPGIDPDQKGAYQMSPIEWLQDTVIRDGRTETPEYKACFGLLEQMLAIRGNTVVKEVMGVLDD